MYKLNIEVMAKAKNHTDNIDSVTLGNIETNSAFVKRFVHWLSYLLSTVICKTVLAITLLWNRAQYVTSYDHYRCQGNGSYQNFHCTMLT